MLHRRPPPPDASRRLSEMLEQIATDASRDVIAVADIRDAMGDRAFGALLFVFAAPGALPVSLPGVSAVLGLPLLVLSLQVMVGRALPWLPRFVTGRTVRRQGFARVMGHALPWMRRAERLLQPRATFLASGPVERLIGFVCAVLSVVLALPIPFGNTGPALAICVLALAVLERDGLAAVAGAILAVASIALAWGVIVTLFKGVSLLLRHWLGL